MFRYLVACSVFFVPLFAAQRPLNHSDYDSWKHIQNQQLSYDGRYLAYAVFPQQGDGELIVRDLKTGQEFRQPVGELPPPPPVNFALPQNEEAPSSAPAITLRFTQDSSAVVFSAFPTHEATETAKRAKLKPEQMPKGELVVMKLPSGEVFRAPSVKNFHLPSKASGFVAYLQATNPLAAPKTEPAEAVDATAPKPKKIETGELVLRNIATGTERKFAAVSEYTLTNDAKLLVFATSAKQPEECGVFRIAVDDSANPAALLSGKGKYEKLAWDQDQTRLHF